MTKQLGERASLGQRIQQAREAAGFSQEEVARALGLSRPTISDIERGKRRVDTLLLRRLARLFGVQPWDLLEPVEKAPQVAQVREALLKEIAPLPPADKEKINRFWLTLEEFARLRKEMGEEPPKLPPSKRFTARSPKYAIEAEADRLREELGLGEFPLGLSIRSLLESQGIPVFLEQLSPEPLSGLFLNHPEVGPVLLVNASQVTWRQVFTLAHEFAHVWLHRHEHAIASRIFAPERDPRKIETQANTFAAELLMPEAGIKRDLASLGVRGPLTPEDVVRLQRYFGVSYKAMLVRLRAMRIISQKQMEELGKESPVRVALRLGYEIDASEVGDVRPLPFYERFPAEYIELVLVAWERGAISEGKAAQLLDVDHLTLNDYLRRLEEAQRQELEEVVPPGVGG